MQNENLESFEKEFTLIDVVLMLSSQWKIILGGALLAGIITAGVTLTMSNKYEATLGLIIKQPEIQMTGEAPPLTPETLTILVESVDIKRKVFDKLMASNQIDPESGFGNFQKKLTAVTQMTKGSSPKQFPFVKLVVEDKSPETAADIANVWGDTVVAESKNIYTQGIRGLSDFIGSVFTKAEESRNRVEIELATKTLVADVEVNQAALKSKQDNIVSLSSDILNLRIKIATQENAAAELRSKIQSQKLDGRWVGETLELKLRAGSDVTLASPTAQTLQIDELIRNLLAREKEILQFRKDISYEAQAMKLQTLNNRLASVYGEIETTSEEYKLALREREEIEKLIPSIPEKLIFNKSITNDPLWSAYVEKQVSPEGFPPLKTEERNPLFAEISSKKMTVTLKLASLEVKREQLRLRRDKLETELEDLSGQKEEADRHIKNFTTGIAGVSQLLAIHRKTYDDDCQQLASTLLLLNDDKTELQIKTQVMEEFNSEREKLAKEISSIKLDLALRERELKKMSSIADSLASKSEELQLSRISTEQSSRSGTDILYRATPNPLKVGPFRSRIVMIVMAVALVVVSTIMMLLTISKQRTA